MALRGVEIVAFLAEFLRTTLFFSIVSSNQAINDAKLWVNGAFGTHIDTVPVKGVLTIKRENLYNRDGIPLSKANIGISRLHLETGDKLYNLEGPAFEQ